MSPAATNDRCLSFETTRLRVRPLDEADEDLYCGLYTDPETMRFIGEPLSGPRAMRAFRRALDDWQSRTMERAVFAVDEKSTNRKIGICLIARDDPASPRAELGIMMLPEASARRYSKECFGSLATFAFSTFPIEEVWVQYSPAHAAAERLVGILGYSPPVHVEKPGSRSSRVRSFRRPV